MSNPVRVRIEVRLIVDSPPSSLATMAEELRNSRDFKMAVEDASDRAAKAEEALSRWHVDGVKVELE